MATSEGWMEWVKGEISGGCPKAPAPVDGEQSARPHEWRATERNVKMASRVGDRHRVVRFLDTDL